MSNYVAWLRQRDTDELALIRRRSARTGIRWLIVTGALFLAGVWWDWRCFPTALIPAAVAGFYLWLSSLAEHEQQLKLGPTPPEDR